MSQRDGTPARAGRNSASGVTVMRADLPFAPAHPSVCMRTHLGWVCVSVHAVCVPVRVCHALV